MKNLVSSILFLIFSVQFAMGQVNGSSAMDIKNNTYDYYYLKHKKQKKIGWILLGAGLAATITGGVLSMSGGFSSGPTSQGSAGQVILGIGLTSSLVSIPFLISSGSNKRKARDFTEFDGLNPDKARHDYFSLKYKKQRKVGWILLGSGVTLGITGIIINANYSGGGKPAFEAVTIGLGAAAALTSVPFLISSGSNKKKAKAFVGTESTGMIGLPTFNNRYLTLGLLIDI